MKVTVQRKRRTQAERSAATRQLLLESTIKCLFEHGYGATTTILVAKYAGISRGAMLHQFPSKADLMTFVVEAVHAEAVAIYADLLADITDPRERMLAYPEAAWKVDSRPAGVAVLEILQGSRSDAELAAKLAPVEARIEANSMAALEQEFHRPTTPALFHLILGAVRGLAITQVLTPEEDATQSIKLLRRLIEVGIEAGVFSSWAERGATGNPKKT
jgi:AcrR family transcriptional regulator